MIDVVNYRIGMAKMNMAETKKAKYNKNNNECGQAPYMVITEVQPKDSKTKLRGQQNNNKHILIVL